MTRLENIVLGPDDEPSRGHVTQVHEIRSGLRNLESKADRLVWLVIAGVVVGLLNMVIHPAQVGSPQQQHTSVITSDASKAAAASNDAHRDWLTVGEVAQSMSVTERAVTAWIAEGRIEPAPVKNGKSWMIDKAFALVPKIAAVSDTVPNDSENCELTK